MQQADKKQDKKPEQKKGQRPIRPRPISPNEGKYTPFAAEMNKISAEENRIKEEARKKAEAARAEAEVKKKEAEHRAKFASVFAYADSVKERHPDIPAELLEKIKTSKTGGEAKRLVRDWVIEKDKAAQQA